MARDQFQRTGREPSLGGQDRAQLTGMEPSLGRDFAPVYGRFRVRGLEAPDVVGRRRPLVVFADHDPDTAHLIQLVATSNGYEVRATDNGHECSRLLGALQPDILILNIRLGGASGLDVIRRTRQDADEVIRSVPVLVMDVHSHPQDVLESFAAGADDYLEMPYDMHVMLRCWRRVTSAVRRPAPLTALQNEDTKIRQVALSHLMKHRPDGLVEGLSDLLWSASPEVSLQVRWALRQLGTPDALAALARFKAGSIPME